MSWPDLAGLAALQGMQQQRKRANLDRARTAAERALGMASVDYPGRTYRCAHTCATHALGVELEFALSQRIREEFEKLEAGRRGTLQASIRAMQSQQQMNMTQPQWVSVSAPPKLPPAPAGPADMTLLAHCRLDGFVRVDLTKDEVLAADVEISRQKAVERQCPCCRREMVRVA